MTHKQMYYWVCAAFNNPVFWYAFVQANGVIVYL